MGLVKIDIHSKERPFHKISFSDIECIKGLIKNRHIIDSYLGIKQNFNIYEAGDVTPVNQELICIYIDLMNLINRCKFTIKQKLIIDLLMQGETEDSIAEELNQEPIRVYKIVDTICRKIKNINDHDWKYNYVYMNYKKVEWNYKTCSKCGEYKPMIDEFFGKDSRNKDGFQSFCKECDSYRKKTL